MLIDHQSYECEGQATMYNKSLLQSFCISSPDIQDGSVFSDSKKNKNRHVFIHSRTSSGITVDCSSEQGTTNDFLRTGSFSVDDHTDYPSKKVSDVYTNKDSSITPEPQGPGLVESSSEASHGSKGHRLSTLPNSESPRESPRRIASPELGHMMGSLKVSDLHSLAKKNRVTRGDGSGCTTIRIRSKALRGTVLKARVHEGTSVALLLRDASNRRVSLVVELKHASSPQHPLHFSAQVKRTFPPGTVVIVQNLVMEMKPSGFILRVDMNEAESRMVSHRGENNEDSAKWLPVHLESASSRLGALLRAGEVQASLKHIFRCLRGCKGMLVPVVDVLSSLAAAHLQVGWRGVALSYAMCASRLLGDETPYNACLLAASILAEDGFVTASNGLLLQCDCTGRGFEAEAMRAAALQSFMLFCKQHPGSMTEAQTRYVDIGHAQIVEALRGYEAQWTGHCKHGHSHVKGAARDIKTLYGSSSPRLFCSEAAALLKGGHPLQAISNWRAALWLMADSEISPECSVVMKLLENRQHIWSQEESTARNARAVESYLDMMALCMMRCRVPEKTGSSWSFKSALSCWMIPEEYTPEHSMTV